MLSTCVLIQVRWRTWRLSRRMSFWNPGITFLHATCPAIRISEWPWTLTGAVGILAFDGYTPVIGDRLLVKNESSTLTNGVYTLTRVGTALIGYVLTRAIDFNQTANVLYGDTVAVLQGTVNANQQFTMNNQTTIAVGTTAITFAQTSGGSQVFSWGWNSIKRKRKALAGRVCGAHGYTRTR